MRMNTQIVLYSYNRLLLTNKKNNELNNMDESYRYYDKHKRVHTIYMIPST